MVISISLVAFVLASFISPKFRFFWKRHTNTFHWLAFCGFLLGGVACNLNGYKDGYLYDQFVNAGAFMLLFFFVPIIYSKLRNKDQDFIRLQQMYGSQSVNQSQADHMTYRVQLPKTLKQRIKVVSAFNKEFELELTEDEIKRICEASFQSEQWAKEIMDMQMRYESASEWYTGSSLPVRLYMKVFITQTISSDFSMQMDIAFRSFEDMFTYADRHDYVSIQDCINDINRTYFTRFDDMTFMLVYRILESNGFRHKLPTSRLASSLSEGDMLTEKYL